MEFDQIIQLINRKNKTGLEALYNQYGEKFYWFAVKKWNLTEDQAWDVVYQTLDTLVLKLDKYDFESQSHFENFLFKVFTNFLRQFYRKSKTQVEEVSVDFLESVGQEGNVLVNGSSELMEEDAVFSDNEDEETVLENPKLNALKIALKQMNSTDRDILLLRAQNYSYDEIASLLSIENNQLKVRHHRAKTKLLQIINSQLA